MYSWLLPFSFGLLICAVYTLRIDDACTTADGRRGQCILLPNCRPLYRAFENWPLTRPVTSFLRKSACGFVDGTPLVCCHDDIDINAIKENEPPHTGTMSTPKVELPAYPDCGNDASDRLIGGSNTEIDEFPWMALMGYTTSNGDLTFRCGGVLLNQRYVLTAAHCVVGAITTKIGSLSIVRLGEHDTSTEVDCDEDGFCAPPPDNIEVEKAVAHPGYTDAKANREDDIALVRLSRDVHFSRFVKPICFPTETPNLEAGHVMVVSGWGRTQTAKESNVKLKVDFLIFDKTQCTQKYSRYKAMLTEKQLCAGGQGGRSACQGDSGGPLMRRNGPKWETVGIISFGLGCGEGGWPGVYTNVYKYLAWIRLNLTP